MFVQRLMIIGILFGSCSISTAFAEQPTIYAEASTTNLGFKNEISVEGKWVNFPLDETSKVVVRFELDAGDGVFITEETQEMKKPFYKPEFKFISTKLSQGKRFRIIVELHNNKNPSEAVVFWITTGKT